MQLFSAIFEDHASVDFRPLSWSMPVYELRCGLFNLRERLQQVLSEAQTISSKTGAALGLLPRPMLAPLQPSEGVVCGMQGCRAALAGADTVLLLSARLGPRWDLLAALVADGLQGNRFAWSDERGLLACAVSAPDSEALLDDWQTWMQDASQQGCWSVASRPAPRWQPDLQWNEGEQELELQTGRLRQPQNCSQSSGLATVLQAAEEPGPARLAFIWDLVPAIGPAIITDTAKVIARGAPVRRQPFGITADKDHWPGGAPWQGISNFEQAAAVGEAGIAPGVNIRGAEQVWLAEAVQLDPGVMLDASAGPIVLDCGARIMSQSYLEGPLYLGRGSLVKSGATIYGETSVGAICKVAGEIAESSLADFSNKQHDGFLGHALLGSWVNLGAGTTCSDLKNNYGPVRVDLGQGTQDTGLGFLGLLMGDHSKSAIGTLFNTGTCVGFSGNVFGSGFPPKYLPNFCWGHAEGESYAVAKAIATAGIVMARRGCILTEAHAALFRALDAEGA